MEGSCLASYVALRHIAGTKERGCFHDVTSQRRDVILDTTEMMVPAQDGPLFARYLASDSSSLSGGIPVLVYRTRWY